MVTLDLGAKVNITTTVICFTSFLGVFDRTQLSYLFEGKQKHSSSFLDLQPAPPVGFNLTFVCPEGEVETTQFVILTSNQPTLGVQS